MTVLWIILWCKPKGLCPGECVNGLSTSGQRPSHSGCPEWPGRNIQDRWKASLRAKPSFELKEPCFPKMAISDSLSTDHVSPWRIFSPEQQKWYKHPGTESLKYLSSWVHASQDSGQRRTTEMVKASRDWVPKIYIFLSPHFARLRTEENNRNGKSIPGLSP